MVDPDEFTILKQDNAKLRAENVALLVPVSFARPSTSDDGNKSPITLSPWQEPERSIDFVRHAMFPVESPTSG